LIESEKLKAMSRSLYTKPTEAYAAITTFQSNGVTPEESFAFSG